MPESKYKKAMMMVIGVILVCCVILAGCTWINETLGMDDDNDLEEVVERFIRDYFYIDADLTPSSPENND